MRAHKGVLLRLEFKDSAEKNSPFMHLRKRRFGGLCARVAGNLATNSIRVCR